MTRPTRDQAIRDSRREAAAAANPGRAGRWPVPDDKPIDRARTLANGLLDALEQADPARAAAIKAKAHGWGELWLGASGAAVEGPWLSRADVARLGRVAPDTVSQWTSRGTRAGKLIRHPNGYAEREVYDFLAALRAGPQAGAQPQEEHG